MSIEEEEGSTLVSLDSKTLDALIAANGREVWTEPRSATSSTTAKACTEVLLCHLATQLELYNFHLARSSHPTEVRSFMLFFWWNSNSCVVFFLQ